jgi:GNAT superfamily N-acetyltransferase
MPALRIRPAEATDLAALTEELGQGPFFTDRLARQASGRGLLLTAWLLNNRPIGDVYLWLEEAEEEPIRQRLPHTPLINHLEIHPDHRRQGSGTKLIGVAEQVLIKLGHNLVALAVEQSNNDAMRLYLRLGYREWPYSTIECLTLADDNGFRETETCHVMIKNLR